MLTHTRKPGQWIGDFRELAVSKCLGVKYTKLHLYDAANKERDLRSTTVTLKEAQSHLAELISKLAPGEEVVITDNEQPVAKLMVHQAPMNQPPRQPGSAKGKLIILADDEEHLEDFKEYMP